MFYFGRLIEQCGFHGNTAGVRPALKVDNFCFVYCFFVMLWVIENFLCQTSDYF